jgi:hypothetical protein
MKHKKLYRIIKHGDTIIFVERVRRTKKAIALGMK